MRTDHGDLHTVSGPGDGAGKEGDAARARRLVMENGWNATSHQVLDQGMSHWFSAAGDAVVGYVEVAGVRVVAGAPVASDARLAAVAEEFESDSLGSGRQVCYFAVEDRLLASTRHRRYASHLIGLQPTWRAGSWSARFESSANLRAQRNRAKNKGVVITELPASREHDADLRACHAAWLASKRLPVLGFLAHSDVAGLDPHALSDRRLFLATTTSTQCAGPSGEPQVVGYLSASPVPRRRGWLVDKVVRHPHAPNGTAELLLDSALKSLSQGSEWFTLGLAPLATTGAADERADDPPAWLRRAEGLALRRGRALYDFRGLHAFKSKFKPDAWEPVYLLSTTGSLGPATFIALARAFLGLHGGSRKGERPLLAA